MDVKSENGQKHLLTISFYWKKRVKKVLYVLSYTVIITYLCIKKNLMSEIF